MKKKWPFILVGCLLIAGVLGSILVLQKPDTSMVEIVQDGKVLYQLDLAQAEDQTVEVEYDGRINTIEIRDHQIRMLEAECPDNTCVHMGWLDSAAPIVCLPNRLVIQFADSIEPIDILAE